MNQFKEPTILEWMIVINSVYDPKSNLIEPLITFGLRMQYYTFNNKLLYYLTLCNYLENRKQDEQKIAELFELRSKDRPSDFKELLRNNPYLNLLEFDQQIVMNLRRLFEEFLMLAQNEVTTNFVKSINWWMAALIELENLPKGELTLVQNVLNETTLRIYRNTENITKLIDRAESIDTNTLGNQLLKTYLLGAVQYAIHQVKDDDQPYLFKLAYAVKNHYYKNADLTIYEDDVFDFSKFKKYMSKYLNKLLDSNHGCVSSIINQAKPESDGYLIQNKKYADYLYVVQIASDVNQSDYRAIFTYIPKNDTNHQGQWFLIFENDHFWIKSAHYPQRQLDTTSAYTVHASTYTALQLKTAVRIIPSQSDNETCYIENYETHRRIYAGGDDKLEDADQRAVYVGDRHLANDDSVLWSFRTYRTLP